MKQKTFIIMIVAIVLIGSAIAGSFIGGVAVGKNQGQEDALANLRNQFNRGGTLQDGTTLPTGVPGGTGFPGRGTTGTIAKIENGVITLTTQSGTTVVVNTSSSTTVQKMETVNLSAIAVGESITVTGTTQSDGSITATNISVMPDGMNLTPPTQTTTQ